MTILKEQQDYKGQQVGTDNNDETKLMRVTKEGYSIVDDLDNAGRNSFNGVFGEQLVSNRLQEISINFSQGIENRAYLDKSTNLGSIEQDDSKLSVESGASANSSGIIESKEGMRYRAGKTFEALFTARFSAPEIGNTRSAGLFDDITGVAIRLIDDEFNFSLKRDSEWIINIPQSEWNADKLDGTGNSNFELNINNLAIYRISGGYLGVAPLTLEVYAGFKKGYVEAHTIDLSNSKIDTHFNYPYLSTRGESINTTATGNNVVQFGSMSVNIFDGGGAGTNDPDVSSREFTVDSGERTLVADTETVVGVFHNIDNYMTFPNKIMSRLLSVSATTVGNKPVYFTVKKLITPPTGGTFTRLHPEDSIIEKSLDSTVTQTQLDNADIMFSTGMGANDTLRENISNLNIRLYPTEYAVLTMKSKLASDVRVTIRQSERF